MPNPCNRVYLDQGNNAQFQNSLETLCRQTSGPLRVDMEEQVSSFAGNKTQRIFLRVRTTFEAICEEFADFFHYDLKAARIEDSLRLLELHLPRVIANVRSDAGKPRAARREEEIPALFSDSDESLSAELPEALRRKVFARVRGSNDDEPAKGMPMHQVCSEVRALRDDPRYMANIPDGLSLSRRHFSRVIADANVVAGMPQGPANDNTDAWADESRTLKEATVKSGQFDTAATWKMAFARQLEAVPDEVRTIALSPPRNVSDEQIDGMLMAVKEKIRASTAAGKRVSIMLAVEDAEVYERIAERMYEAQGSTYMKPEMLALESSAGILVSSVDPQEYDHLLTLTQKLAEDAKRPVRAKIEHCGLDRKAVLYERQLLDELFEPDEKTAKRKSDTLYALVHAFEPILQDARARGVDEKGIEIRQSLLDTLLGKITGTQEGKASGNDVAAGAVGTPFERVPLGFTIAPPESSPLQYIANTVILGSGMKPEASPNAPQELKGAVKAFDAAWRDPRKTQEYTLRRLKDDDTTKGPEKTVKWWKVACEDGLHHIEQLHAFSHDAKEPQPWPTTREGFKALYLAMFAGLRGSVVLEPILDRVESSAEGSGRPQKLKCSRENLEGMLDAIAETTVTRLGAKSHQPELDKPLLSIVVTIPESEDRMNLIAAVPPRPALAKESKKTCESALQVPEFSRVPSSARSKVFADSSDEDGEDSTEEDSSDEDGQSGEESNLNVGNNIADKSMSDGESNVDQSRNEKEADAKISRVQSTAMPIQRTEHRLPQALVMECSPSLRLLSNAQSDETSVKFASTVDLMHMHGLYKCPPGLSVVPVSPLSINCNSLIINSGLSKYSVYGNGSAFKAIHQAYREAMVTNLLNYEDAMEPNGAIHLAEIDGLPHIDDLWVILDGEDGDDVERTEPHQSYWRSFYTQLLINAAKVNPGGSTVLEPSPSYWIRNDSQSTPIWTDENVAGLATAALLVRDKNAICGKGFLSITLAITDAELKERVEKELIRQEWEFMMS